MRISGRPRNAQVSVVLAAGLIVVAGGVLPGRFSLVASATATPGATTPGVTATPSATGTAPARGPHQAKRARSSAGPALSISVSDGRTAANPGDQITYLVSVRDGGTASAPHLKITQNLVGRPGLPLGQPSRERRRRPGHLARRHPGGRNEDLPRGGARDADAGPAASAGGCGLRLGRRQHNAHRLRGSPRSAARRCGRVGLPGRRDVGRGPGGVCRGVPGGARRRRAHGDRSPACRSAAAGGLTFPPGQGTTAPAPRRSPVPWPGSRPRESHRAI